MKERTFYYEYLRSDDYNGVPRDELPRRAITEGFKGFTTAHGIPHVNNARGVVKKTFWFIMTLGMIGLLFYYGYTLVTRFMDWPVNVLVEVVHKKELTFPAITVCNHNPVTKTAASEHEELRVLLGIPAPAPAPAPPADGNTQDGSMNGDGSMAPTNRRKRQIAPGIIGPVSTQAPGPMSGPDSTQAPVPAAPDSNPAPDSTQAPGPMSGPDSTQAPGQDAPDTNPAPDSGPADDPSGSADDPSGSADDPSGSADDPSGGDSGDTYGGGPGLQNGGRPPRGGRESRADFELRLKAYSLISALDDAGKKKLGIEIDDFVIDCEYSGYTCSTDDFTHFYNSVFGNCFTFNSGWNSSYDTLEKSFRPGPQFGLKLTFNVDQDEYIGGLAESAGVRLVVHPQSRMPFPDDEGVSLGPGQFAYVGVRMLNLEKKGGKYTTCTNTDVKNTTRNVFEEIYPVNYSPTACYKTCYQKYIIDECGCGDNQYPIYGAAFDYRNVSACDSTDTDEAGCMDNVTDRYQNDELECYCPSACQETAYYTSSSTVYWPSEDYKVTLFNNLASENEKIKRVLNSAEDPDKYQKNLLKAVVYFEEFNYESIVEVPAYLSVNFVSDVGGILGLFLGFSFLTILEFLELGVDLSVWSLTSCCRTKVKSARSPLTRPVEKEQGEMTDMKISPPPPYHQPFNEFTKK